MLTQMFYLHRIAFIIVHAENNLHVFRGLLFTSVKLSLKQGYVNIIPNISWRKNKRSLGGRAKHSQHAHSFK